MKTSKGHKHFTPVLTICLFLLLSLSACGREGKLHEGDCILNVSFIDIPKEYNMQEENLQERSELQVTLQNTVTEKIYSFALNSDNDYYQKLTLKPGTYEVLEVINTMEEFNGIEIDTNTKKLELSAKAPSELLLSIEDAEEFTSRWMDTQPMPEILLADKFSRMIQINRQVIPIKEIAAQLSLNHHEKLKPSEKLTLSDEDFGITITVENTSDELRSYRDCRVLNLEFTKNTVVFPEGVTLGMSPTTVFHSKDGLYGEPTSLGGTIFYGAGMQDTKTVYKDPASGDTITIKTDPEGKYIIGISYEFAYTE